MEQPLKSEKESSLWFLAFLGILFAVPWLRSKSHTPFQQYVKAAQAQDNTNWENSISDNKSNIPISIVKVELPKAETTGLRPKHRLKYINRLRKAGSFWVGLFTMLIVLAYTVITRNQLEQTTIAAQAAKGAADTAARSFQTYARPYIVIDNVQKADKDSGARIFCSSKPEQICVRIHYTVTGQTPAIDVQREVRFLGEKDSEVAEDVIEHWNPKHFESPDGFPPMSTTNHTWDDPVEDVISPEQADLLLMDKGIVYVYGVIKYRDLLECRHVTRFCFVQSVTPHCPKEGCFGNCQFGNHVDMERDVPTEKDKDKPCHDHQK
jgi:hypothetical protein